MRQSLAIEEKIHGPRNIETARSLSKLAEVLGKTDGKREEAGIMFRRAVAIKEEILGEDHSEVGDVLEFFADFLESRGKTEEAARMRRRVEAIKKANGNSDDDDGDDSQDEDGSSSSGEEEETRAPEKAR